MKKSNSFRSRVRGGATTFLILLTLASFLSPVAFGTSTPPYQANGFNILSVVWGTSAVHSQAGPGDTDVPLTVTLQYIYPTSTAVSTSGTLDTKGTGFSASNGSPNSTVYYIGSLTPGSIFELTFYLDLNSSLKAGSHYSIPLTMLWSAVLTNSSVEPETSLIQSATISVSINGDAYLTFRASQSYLTSGQVNHLNFTVSNNGTGPAASILTTLSSQQAGVQSVIPEIQNLSPGSSATFPLEIYVPQSSAGSVTPLSVLATFRDPYGNNASTSQIIDLHSSTTSQAKLVFSAEKETLIPGESNNITLTLTNIGLGNVSDIVTTTSSSLQGISTLVDLATLSSLGPGGSYTANITVYISASAAGQGVTLTFSSTFLDAYGTSESSSQQLGFQIAASTNFLSSTFSITTISNSVVSGSISMVTFHVKNTGSATIYTPDFSISVTQPLVVAGNSTSSSTTTSIAPGQSEDFTTELTASPGSASGIYPAQLEISFSDQYGSTHNQSYPVAILLSGSIQLVVQNEAFSQNATGITVTGNLLNEGSTSASYLSLYGYLNNSKLAGSPNYIGEVDVNTPVPFTITIPYQARSSAMGNVTIALQFRNNLGQLLNSSWSETAPLRSSSGILPPDSTTPSGTTGSTTGPSFFELAIILTVVLVAAGVGIFAILNRRKVRKIKSRSSTRIESKSIA